MNAQLPEAIEAVRDAVNRFMEAEINPQMDAVERSGIFPRDLVRKAGALGLYGAVFPESVGGTNLGYLAAAVVSEELARNDARFAACNNQQASSCPPCLRPCRNRKVLFPCPQIRQPLLFHPNEFPQG